MALCTTYYTALCMSHINSCRSMSINHKPFSVHITWQLTATKTRKFSKVYGKQKGKTENEKDIESAVKLCDKCCMPHIKDSECPVQVLQHSSEETTTPPACQPQPETSTSNKSQAQTQSGPSSRNQVSTSSDDMRLVSLKFPSEWYTAGLRKGITL